MITKKAQEILGRVLTAGVLLVTVVVEAWKSSEPVNAPKMLILSAVGVSALFVIVVSWSRNLWKLYRQPITLLLIFLVLCFLSIIISKDNSLVGIFGTKGRSTGLVTYFSLAALFLAAVVVQSRRYYDLVIKILILAGIINVIYNFTHIFGFDPIPWSNPFGTILGTFGNPNFISSFLGMLFSVLLASAVNPAAKFRFRAMSAVVLPIIVFQIVYSNSIQGLFVCSIGAVAVFFFYLRSNRKLSRLLPVYLVTVLTLGIVAILGMLQKGPLASIIYKTSVSLRGEYWAAGLNMGFANPFTGVGLDSYGNWYRLFRRPSAMVLPGPSVVSDSAHNVFIDFFASGGFPLLIAYVSIQILVLLAIFRILKNLTSFTLTPVALIAAWLGYTGQSVISINQIGLAVWGWVLGGAIIGYSILDSQDIQSEPKSVKTKQIKKEVRSEAAVSLAAIVGLVIGFLLALPPVRADMAWRSALKVGNAGAIDSAMKVWPQNQRTLNAGIVLFANNGLPEKALEWARIDVKANSENYVSWFTLYNLPGISQQEKTEALTKLRQLDPLNPEWK